MWKLIYFSVKLFDNHNIIIIIIIVCLLTLFIYP